VEDGGGCGSWRRAGLGVDGLAWLRQEEAGEKPRRGRLGERDWLRRKGGRAWAISGGGDGGSGTV